MEFVFEIPFFVLIGGFLYHLFLVHKILGVLKERHRETWALLGNPDLFKNISITNSDALSSFINERRYEALRDKTLDSVANKARVLHVFNRVLFAVLLALILIVALIGQFG